MVNGTSADVDRSALHQQNSTTDSLGGDTSIDEYKKRLRRRRKKASDGCWDLTCYSWFFLLVALLQVAVVTGIQIAIAVLGGFRNDRLEQYVECLEASLEESLKEAGEFSFNDTPIELPSNFTYPSFGRDKEIYVYFFIAVVLYNFFLCFYALKFQNIVEVYMFMVINILAMGYACLQVFQFRGFGELCSSVTNVGYLALANVLVLLIFTFVFAFLSLFIYVEFGWKTYVLVDCNPGMRYYYRVYQVFMSVLKLFLLFLVIFCVSQDVLILRTDDPEFYLTILIGLAAILAYPIIYLIVTFEFLLGAIGLLLLGLCLVAYYAFKIYRYISRSCPVCVDRENQLESELQFIREQFGDDDAIVDLFDRRQEFVNLTLFGVVSLIINIVVIIVFIHYWRQFGNGLKEYFGKQKFQRWVAKRFCCWCEKCSKSSESSQDAVDRGSGVSLTLFDRKKTKGRNDGANRDDITVSRDSTKLDRSDYEPAKPNFDAAAPTNSQRFAIN